MNKETRNKIFLIGCLGTRLALSILTKYISIKYLKYIGYITLIPAIGFIVIYLFNLRKNGAEADGLIWWNKIRPIHGVLYLLFSIYAIKKERFAWLVILIDTILGLFFWYLRYYKNVFFI